MTEDEAKSPPATVRELGIEFRGFVALNDERLKNLIATVERLTEALERSNYQKADKVALDSHIAWGEASVKSLDSRVSVLENDKLLSENSVWKKLRQGFENRFVSIIVVVIIAIVVYAMIKLSQPSVVDIIQ